MLSGWKTGPNTRLGVDLSKLKVYYDSAGDLKLISVYAATSFLDPTAEHNPKTLNIEIAFPASEE